MEQYLTFVVPSEMLKVFQQQAEQKIAIEGWGKQGRNVDVKVRNFFNCWVTEEAFKQILIREKAWFRNRGMYFGDAQGAGADFTVRVQSKEVTIGLRSIQKQSLEIYKQVAYPDDRIREEQNKIADYHIACYHEGNGLVQFLGIISKKKMLQELTRGERKYSPQNQEYFRVLPLEQFSVKELKDILQKMEKI